MRNRTGRKQNGTWRSTLSQVSAALSVNLALLGNGLILGYPTILIAALSEEQNHQKSFNEENLSWIGSMMFISVPVGSFFSGILSELLGKIKMIQCANVPFFIAWMIFFCSTKIWHIYSALILIGFVGGFFETPVVTFVAEMSEPRLRGMLTSSSILFFVVGIMTQFVFATFMNWQTAALCSGIFPTASFIVLFWIPESPVWLISKKRYSEAKHSLAWFRGWVEQEEIAEENEEFLGNVHRNLSSTEENEHSDKTFKHYILLFSNRKFIVPFILLTYMFFLTQFTGLYAVQTYAITIFESLRSPIDKYHATALFGVSSVIGCALTLVLLPLFGKRKMCFLSLGVIALCFLILGLYAFNYRILTLNIITSKNIESSTNINELQSYSNNQFSWIPIGAILFGITLAKIGIHSIPWILNSEIFPREIRAVSAGISATSYYIFLFLSNKYFLSMVSLFTLPGTFWFFSVVSLTGLVVLFIFLPETEGVKLEDINVLFSKERGVKFRTKTKCRII